MSEQDSDEEFSPAPHNWFEKEDSSVKTMEDAPTSTNSATIVASPRPSPSWKELSSQVLPAAARELLSSSLRRVWYTAQKQYAFGRNKVTLRSSKDLHSVSGFYRNSLEIPDYLPQELPACSSLSWVDRQMVQEWRTYHDDDPIHCQDDQDFEAARTLIPLPLQKPSWENLEICFQCRQAFGPTRMRHHCRRCGHSFCQTHSNFTHKLPHLGYDPDVPERVCDSCKEILSEQNLAERVAWRLARCRDLQQGNLTPYFEIGVDTLDQVAARIARAAITMAKSIPLGAQATIAVETVDVLRKHGLNGIYTIMLRQEFLAAADLLQKALGINHASWPLSVHELSAAIFYALAQHRALRGMNPELEHQLHAFRPSGRDEAATQESSVHITSATVSDLVSNKTPHDHAEENESTEPVCDPVDDEELRSLLFFAPLALNFVYSTKEVDMQLLAAQQGWRLLYAHLDQEAGHKDSERPASALFIHEEKRVACISIRGTSTIHDVITDIRQIPVPFPENDPEFTNKEDGDWTTVFRGQGLAVSGMASAALTLYREHIDALLTLAGQGYKIRITGHSLGGGVATMLGVLVHRDLKRTTEEDSRLSGSTATDFLRVYAYGTPSCVDAKLADFVDSFVTTVVHHDDVIPRLTPTSCRGLLKHLLYIRETWVRDHFSSDIMAVTERARLVWAPRWREGFTLASSSRSIKRFCKKKYQLGKEQLVYVKEKLVRELPDNPCLKDSTLSEVEPPEESIEDDVDDFIVEPRPMVDILGGVDKEKEAIVMDGDEFFDPPETLVEEEDESHSSLEDFVDAVPRDDENNHESVTEDYKKKHDVEGPTDSDESPGAVLLDEVQLPKMYVPGKIVHIYSHRGIYRAAHVPRNFRELRSISMAGNMLSDHKCKSYYEGLLEVRSVRRAIEHPPRWSAFDEDDTCSCCASKFTWASTSSSAAQEARDKHNCRSCGTLVCDPCSQNRIPIPSIGLTVPGRVCDRCYHDSEGLIAREGPVIEKVERTRDRRSAVVDELAFRVHTASIDESVIS